MDNILQRINDKSSGSAKRSHSRSLSSERKKKKKKSKKRAKILLHSSSSSSEDEKRSLSSKKKKKHKSKKRKHEKRKLEMCDKVKVEEKSTSDSEELIGPLPNSMSNDNMKPLTKDEWEKKQSTVRKVYDEETGRNRLVRGDGEILEGIVSYKQHKEINKAATAADGVEFKKKTGLHKFQM